jgi:protein-S-isoprenylcysteine O-methyltransferase Ste14
MIHLCGPTFQEASKDYPGADFVGAHTNFSAEDFARMVAKIGFCAGVFALGLGPFTNTPIKKVILGSDPCIGYWVGSWWGESVNGTHGGLHEIRLMCEPGSQIHAFVRLFAQFGAPEYHVLLGPADPKFVASSSWPSVWDQNRILNTPREETNDQVDRSVLGGNKLMTTRQQHGGGSTAVRGVANLGFVRPPLVYLISLVSGTVINLALPLPFLSGRLAVALGVPLIAVAIALFSYSVAQFRAAGTPVPARKPTTVIVCAGPYRFSRNPIYLAFSVFQLSIAFWVNSVWLLATLVGAVALIHYVVIPREEQYLERKFGAQYMNYKASVRRWL